MLSVGGRAPTFELPALVDGERRRVALSEFLGEDVIILAFYPADFNPACDADSCDLDELDLFTMQKDVTVLGISPDSVYSHRAFAERYDLKIPLLADTAGEVAERYDVAFVDDIGQRLLERAVAVVDHDGVVQYTWSTSDLTELPRVEELKDAIADTGGDDTAFARYRVGHAHYTEGRRAFTAAMGEFGDSEWMLAQSDFQRAREAFDAASDQFDTAVRFVDDPALEPIYDGSKAKASALWQAADWLVAAASAYAGGSGAEGQTLRDDAEGPLETARTYAEPPDPDERWPPERTDLAKSGPETSSILPDESEEIDTALDVDIDDAVASDGDGTGASDESANQPSDPEPAAAEADGTANGDAATETGGENEDGEGGIDDDELAEIQAELAANSPDAEPPAEAVTEAPTAMVDAPPAASAEDDGDASRDSEAGTDTGKTRDGESDSDGDDESVSESGDDAPAELELTDPTEGPDDE
ncbi:redoxin domain-containing protein [Haloarcula nitratireducens]|uniref:Redoxin domain-containing protein n=1 Tax=Haloarcula nitratireducens TaxID=2487749 RepID=A0AAW4PEM2_9EURY|nr:redoxin domain-containing protein [Halomicroarcula nitratireducens]MBX0296050.1 redoxin domain-containing protein [Halomicroarcula nitratireducens]